jgi:hypothetical protein
MSTLSEFWRRQAPPGGMPPPVSNPDENESTHIAATTLAVTIIALVIVVIRFYVRSFLVRSLGWDDWLMALAMAVVSHYKQACSLAASNTRTVHHSINVRCRVDILWPRRTVSNVRTYWKQQALTHDSIGDVDPNRYMIGMKLNFLSQPFLMWGVAFVKLSVGFGKLSELFFEASVLEQRLTPELPTVRLHCRSLPQHTANMVFFEQRSYVSQHKSDSDGQSLASWSS